MTNTYTPDDVRRVFRGEVLPIEPIPYKITRVPIAELHEMMCNACVLRPENMRELAEVGKHWPKPDWGPRNQSLEDIEEIDPVEFQRAMDEALEESER